MKELLAVGFTPSEIAVYEALLALGTSTVTPIIEKSGIASSKSYEVLGRLIDKGMVSYVVQGRGKHYTAAHPRKLLEYMDKRAAELMEQREAIADVIPALSAQKDSGTEAEATIYRGFSGLQTAFNEALDAVPEGAEVCVANVPAISSAEDRFFKHWNERRASRKIRLRMILDEEARGQLQATSNPLSTLRYLPSGVRGAAAINVYADRVVLFLPADDNGDRLVIVVKNDAVVESFRLQFEEQWKSAAK